MPNLSQNDRLKLRFKFNKRLFIIFSITTITILVLVLLGVWFASSKKKLGNQRNTSKIVSTNEVIKKWIKGQVTTVNYSYEFEYPENWRFTERPNTNSIYFEPHGLGINIYYSENVANSLQNTILRQITTNNKIFDVKKGSSDSAVNYSTDVRKNNFTASVWVEKDFPTRNDYIFDHIATSFSFTYTKPACGNQIEKLTFIPPTNWTKTIEMPCAVSLGFKSPELKESSTTSQLGASISITLYAPYETFENECADLEQSKSTVGARKNIDCTKIISNKKAIYSTYDDEGYSIIYDIRYDDTETYSIILWAHNTTEIDKFIPTLNQFLNNLKFN